MSFFPPLKPTIQAALRDVSSTKPAARLAAVDSLREAREEDRDRAVESLRPRLDDPDVRVRVAAIDSLVELDDVESADRIAKCFDDPEAAVREVAVAAIVDLGRETERYLATALRSEHAEVRFQAIVAYESTDLPIDSRVASTLSDSDPFVRQQAAITLGVRGHRPAQSALRRLLNDPEKTVRRAAAVGLAHLGDEEALEPLVAGLADQEFLYEASWALGQLGHPAAIVPIRKLAERFLTPATAKLALAAALHCLGEARGRDMIERALTSRRAEVRAQAIGLVARLDLQELRPQLQAIVARGRRSEAPLATAALKAMEESD